MKKSVLSLLWLVILSLLAGQQVMAQNQLELSAGSQSSTVTGATTTPQTLTLLENTTGTTFVPATPATTVSFSLSNQQYTGTYGNINAGLVFGAAVNFTANTVTSTPVSQSLGILGGATNGSFTSSPCGPAGTGVDVSTNYGIRGLISTKPLSGSATTGRYRYADLTITFNRPVDNPVLNFGALGNSYAGTNLGTQYYSGEFDLIASSPAVTLSKLSGSTELNVTSTSILNNAAQPNSNCGNGAACGSVLVSGTGITSITFRVYLRGVGTPAIVLGLGASAWDGATVHYGDGFMLGVSLDAAPIPTSTTLTNACPATTADLTSVQPAVAGATYEWHTVASGPSSANIVSNPASVSTGTYYLYSLNATNCYSPASAPVSVSLVVCPLTCNYLTNTDFEVSGQNPSQYVIADQSTLVPPWRTTASDGQMELWRTGFNGVPSYSGNQFIELNANLSATTYQNFTAAPGATFTLNFAHRGRDGIDVVNVSIGSAIASTVTTGTAATGTVYNNLGNFSDNNTAWGYYTRTFTIPANATGTNFSVRFTTVSTATGNTSSGNFLDAISISDIAPAPNTTSLTIVCPATTADLSSLTATNQPVSTTQTFHSGPVATVANRLASTNVGPGTYYTAFFNGQKGCYGATTAITVTLVTPVAPTATVTGQPSCSVATGTITITAPIGAGLTYSVDGTNYSTSLTYSGLSSGTYAVRVRNGSATCTSPATSVVVTAGPTAPAAPSVVLIQPTCSIATGTISVTAPTGTGITYSINGTTYTSATTFTGVSAGTYNVTAKGSNGCNSAQTSATINSQPPTPVATLSSATICNGTSVTLASSGGTTYLFSTGVSNTTGLLVVAPTTNGSNPYSVTVTNTQNCTAVASATITVNPSVTATLTSTTICKGLSGTLTAGGAGTGGSYVLNPGNLSSTSGVFVVSPTTNGVSTYTVTATSQFGCVGTSTGTVTVNPSVTATLTSTTICNGLSGTLTAGGAGTGGSYVLNPGNLSSATGVFVVLPTTNGVSTYTVTATSQFGCVGTSTGTVTVNPSVTATLTSTTICNGLSGTLTAGGAGTGGSYVLNPGNLSSATGVFVVSPTINGVSTYTVTATSQFGCVGVSTGTVTVNPSVTATLTSTTICNGLSGTLTAGGAGTGGSYVLNPGNLSSTSGVFVVSPTTNGVSTYTVTATSQFGCIGVATGTVTVNPSVTATLTSTTICNGLSGTLTAGGAGTGGSYVLNPGNLSSATGVFVVSPTTNGVSTYTVTATSQFGCVGVSTGTVTVNPSVTATLTSTTICNGLSGTLTAGGAGTGGSYVLNPGNLTSTSGVYVVSPTTNGVTTYTVTATSQFGCVGTSTGTVTVNPSVTATLTSTTICNGLSGTLTAGGAGTGGSYVLNPGNLSSATGVFIVSPTTNGVSTYTVTATSQFGCIGLSTGTVTVNPSVTATLTSTTICNGLSGTLTAGGAGTGGSYVLNPGNLSSATGVFIVSPTTNGVSTYTVTATSQFGCIGLSTGTVTVNPLVTATLTSTTICNGLSGTLTAGGAGTGGSYVLNPGNLSSATGVFVVSPTTNGVSTYTVTATSQFGCIGLSTGTVTVNPSVTATLTSTTICNGLSGTLTAGGAGTGGSYVLNPGNLSSTSGVFVVSPTTNGVSTYTVTATSQFGCIGVSTGTVTVNPSVTATLTSTTICNGLSGTLTAGGAGTGGSYVLNPGNLSSATGVFVLSPTINGVSTYTVTATSQFGCVGVSTGTVTVNPSVTATLTSTTICNGLSGTLTAGGAGTGGSYVLNPGNLSSATGVFVVSPTTNGVSTYTVTATSQFGCIGVSTGTVTVNPSVTATLTSTTICNGLSGTLTAGGAGTGGSYVLNPGNLSSATGVFVVSPTINGVSTYTVTATSQFGCVGVSTGTVTVNPSVTATLTSTTICNGLSGTLTAGGAGTGGSYVLNPGNLSSTSGVFVVSPTTNGVSTYTVTATSQFGCIGVSTGTVTVNPSVTATLTSTTICNGLSGTLTAGGAGTGGSYVLNPGNLSSTSGVFVVSPTTNGVSTYTVTATSQFGCVGVSTGTVTVNPLVTATLTSTTICNGLSGTLTAGGAGTGGSYVLNPGNLSSATGVFIVSPTTNGVSTYTVTATSQFGCVGTSTGTVTVNPSVTATLTSTTICNGLSGTLTAGGAGTGGSYVLNPGNLTSTSGVFVVSPTTNGVTTYTVTATSQFGCIGVSTGTVTVNPSVTATLTSTTICNGLSGTLTAGGAGTGGSYVLNPGNLTSTSGVFVVSPTTNGVSTYTVTATSQFGCIGVSTGTITVNPSVTATLTSTTICNGLSGTLTAGGAGTGGSYVLNPGNLSSATGVFIVSPTTNGVSTYTVTATSQFGCVGTSTGTVTVNPSVTATLTSTTICNGLSGTLTAGGAGTGGSYVLNPGNLTSTSGVFVVSPTTNGVTTYTVTATSQFGCVGTSTGTVTVNPSVTATLTSTTICNGLSGTLTAGGAGTGGSYVLNPGNLTSTSGVFVVSPTTNGVTTYTVTATSQFGCVGVATGTVTVNPSVTATLTSTTICNGVSGTLTASGAGTGGSYVLNPGNLSSATGVFIVSPTTNGVSTYTVTATSQFGCVGTSTGTVTVNPSVTATLTSTTICNGLSGTLTASGAGTGGSYVLNPGNLSSATGVFIVSPTTNGVSTYTVTATSQFGCVGTSTGTVTVNPSVTATLTSTTICNGLSGTLTASGAGTGGSYVLNPGNLSSATGVFIVSPTTNGVSTYTVTATSQFGCVGTSTGTVTVNPSVTATLTSTTICNGLSGTLTASGAGTGGSYVLNPGNLSSATGVFIVSPTTNGVSTYTVTATSQFGCVGTSTGTVTVNPSVTATLTSTTICNGLSGTLTAGGAGTGGSYVLNPGNLSSATGVFVVSPTINGVSTYTVTATSQFGCVGVSTGTVTVNPSVTATLTSTTICNGLSGTLTAGGAGTGGSYVLNPGNLSSATGVFIVSPTTNGVSTYTVTATSQFGCVGTSTGTVTVNPSVTATLTSTTICNGLSGTLTAGGAGTGGSYVLNPGNLSSATGVFIVSPTTNGVSTYTVTATSQFGCIGVSTGTVTVNPSVTATLTSTTICNGLSGTLTAGGAGTGGSYVLNPGNLSSATGVFVVSPTTNGVSTYTVTATSQFGCIGLSTGTVTVNPSVTATLTSTTICNGLSGTLTAGGAGTGGSYVLNPGNLTSTSGVFVVSPTTNGVSTYTVTATSQFGCIGVSTGTVTVNPSVTATLTSTTICNGLSGTLTAGGAGTGGSYVLNPGNLSSATGVFIVSPTTNGVSTYTVTATSQFGCIGVSTGTVTVNPSVTATLTSTTICNGLSGTLTAGGAGTGGSYVLNPGNLSSTSGVFVVSPTTNGVSTYTVTATSQFGCIGVSTGTVTVNPSVTATLTSTTICNGLSGTLTAGGAGTGGSYVLNPGNLSSTSGVFVVSPTTNGVSTYTVTATSQFGCIGVSTGTVTVNPSVTATLTSTTICNGLSGTLTAGGAGTGGSYVLNPGNLSSATGVFVVSPTTNGVSTYTVTATSQFGCVGTSTGTVTVNPSVTATLTSTTICNGLSGTLTAGGAGTGGSYVLNPGNLSSATGVFIVSPTTNGVSTYTVTATSQFGCIGVSTGTVTVNPSVTATLTSTTICNGLSGTLTAGGAGTGGSYVLNPGNLSSATGVFVVSPTTNGVSTYTVTATSQFGCIGLSTGTVTVNPSVTATLSVATICNGTSTTLTATGGSSYRFSEGTTNTNGILVVAPNSNGANPYSVTVTSTQGCTAVATGNVTVNPSVTATLSSATICNGTSATLTATGGSSYRFGPGMSNTTGLLVVSPTAVGSNLYSVTVTSAQGCTAVAYGNVTVNPLPQPTILGSTSVCAGQPISLTASPTTGLTYAWSGPGGNLGSSNPLTIAMSTSANAGTYQVMVTDANGCTAVASQNVTVKPVPQVKILNTSIVCANNSPAVAISTQVTGGSPPVSYAWYRSGVMGVISTDPNPVFSVADTYSLIVTDASGCMSNTATVAVMTPNPLAVNVQTTNALCFNAQGRITVTTNGGTAPYTVSYYNASGVMSSTTTASVSTLQTVAGSYTVVVMDANNCSLSQTASITQPPLLVVTLAGSGSVCAGQNTGSISTTVTGGTTPYSYSWSNGMTTPNLTGLSGGSYSVTVTDVNGCVATGSVTLPTNPLPPAPTVRVTQPTCVTLTGTIQVLTPASGVQYSFDNGTSYQLSPTKSGLQPDVYQLRVRDNATGCASPVTSVTINPVPNPPVVSITGNTTYCAGQPISLSASPVSGVTYAWSGPGGSLSSTNPLVITSATPAQTGTYTVTVTDGNGCTAVATTSVVIYALPVATLIVNSATMCYGQPISLTAGGGGSYAFSGNVTGVSGNTASFTAAQGTAQYSVTVTSGQGCLSAPATVMVTVVSCVYPAPDSGTVSAGTGGTAVANVTTNDLINTAPATLGINGNATIAAIGTYPPGITLNPATGSVSVTAGVAVPGSYTIAYQLCDKLTPVTCATTTVSITVLSSINPAPDSGTVASGTGGVAVTNVVTNDLVDGAPARLGTGGNATIAAIGTYAPGITLDPATGSVSVAVGTPPGTYTVAYQLCNLVSPITCATTTVTVTVTPAPPVATGDINSVNVNTSVSGNVLTNDYDPQGLPLTASLTTPPTAGTLIFSANGSYTYTPPVDFTGLASFTYTICNSASLCATATATINVLPNPTVGNNAPVAHNDATRTRLGQPVRIAVLANDTDPDSPLSPNGQLSNPVLLSQPASGTAVVNPDGSVTYTPTAGFTGVVSFPYQVCDQASPPLCATAQVTVNVLPPVLAGTVLSPVGVDDALLTKINTPATGNVSTNDIDANSPILSLTYATGQPGSGTVVMSATGSYTYTPAAGFAGPTSFTYSVCNTAGLCSAATVNIVVQVTDKVGLLAKVYLQGALLGVYAPSVLMRDDLRTRGLIPTTSPYGMYGALTATGSLSASVTAVTGNDAIVDWVFVELRSPVSNTVVVDSRSALLQRDGDIVDVDGVSPVRFDVALAGGYYVVVRHRNHLGVMTGLSVPLSVSASVVDFRSASTPTFSYTSANPLLNQAQVVVDQGFAMWAGNALSDNLPTAPHEQILFQGTNNDVNAIYQRGIAAPGNLFVSPFYKLKGYYSTDLDLNGETQFQGSGNDVETIYQNIIKNHPGNSLVVPYFIIREQLP